MKKCLPERLRTLTVAVFTALMSAVCIHVQAQSTTVTGSVRDGGNPLPGVSILERGTTNGTTSDALGNDTPCSRRSNILQVLIFLK